MKAIVQDTYGTEDVLKDSGPLDGSLLVCTAPGEIRFGLEEEEMAGLLQAGYVKEAEAKECGQGSKK